jgi:hypothetical protein
VHLYIPFYLFRIQWTWKAYAALLEGPFADSMLRSPRFCVEHIRPELSFNVDETGAETVEDQRHSLELLKKLEDRAMENVNKFPWKTTVPEIFKDEGCLDFT